jgi:uncharacterized membrane protein
MVTLSFLACLAAIVGVVLAIEADGSLRLRSGRSVGLLTWLTSGNWPAKVGGAFIIVGVGALLRYALINIQVDDEIKVGGGIVIALALGFASMFVPDGAAKRPVSLALGGAAFGVAYLTAYSAFAMFHYLDAPMGLALLCLTSVAAAVHAVTRSALSLALLAMFGAYLAPAFAVEDPGPLVVYGYYVAASAMTLIMVSRRNWRALMHLSFVFTIAGGVFFGWTSQYYDPAHADVMLMMLLILAAIHVAMPLCQMRAPGSPWLDRFDIAYTVALPAIAALLATLLAADKAQLTVSLLCLGTIWLCAAVVLRLMSRTGAAVHLIIGLALQLLGVFVRFENLPWEIVLLGFSVGTLALAAWREPERGKLHNTIVGFVVIFGALHVLRSIPAAETLQPFLSSAFVQRFVAAILLIAAGTICRRIRQPLDTLLLAVGILWLFISVGRELVRWDLATVALIAHWFTILVAASLWIPGRRVRIADNHTVLLLAALLLTGWWASLSAPFTAAWITLTAASLALVGVAIRPDEGERQSFHGRVVAALLAPTVAYLWALRAVDADATALTHLAIAIAVVVAVATLVAGRFSRPDRTPWLRHVADVFAVCFGVLLLNYTLADIARGATAILLELAILAGVFLIVALRRWQQRKADLSMAAAMIAVALVVQANLVRVLSPAAHLDITDVLALKWPAAISLLWAATGCVLTIWSRRVRSRTLWSAGAGLLVAAAIKLLLIDFGSLGELANILAVIAAGGVFLLVGWLAPIPPGASGEAADRTMPAAQDDDEEGAARQRGAWTIGIVLIGVVSLSNMNTLSRMMIGRLIERPLPVVAERRVPQPEAGSLQSVAPEPAVAETSEPTVQGDLDPTLEAPVTEAAVDPEPAQPAAPPVVRAPPSTYQPPPTIDAQGVRTYTQYSLPQPRHTDPLPAAAAPPPPPLADAGIYQLLSEGRIRRATKEDVAAWSAASGIKPSSIIGLEHEDPFNGGFVFRTYVVKREMTFPPAMYGAHSANFIVPRSVPRPYGDPGHSRVLEYPEQ